MTCDIKHLRMNINTWPWFVLMGILVHLSKPVEWSVQYNGLWLDKMWWWLRGLVVMNLHFGNFASGLLLVSGSSSMIYIIEPHYLISSCDTVFLCFPKSGPINWYELNWNRTWTIIFSYLHLHLQLWMKWSFIKPLKFQQCFCRHI